MDSSLNPEKQKTSGIENKNVAEAEGGFTGAAINNVESGAEQKASLWREWVPVVLIIVVAGVIGWQLGQPKNSLDLSKDGANGAVSVDENNSSTVPEQFLEDIDSPATEKTNSEDAAELKNTKMLKKDAPLPVGDLSGQVRLSGVIFPSLEPLRGNAVLKIGDQRMVYLWTRQDLRQFLGKEVMVIGQGTIEKFISASVRVVSK